MTQMCTAEHNYYISAQNNCQWGFGKTTLWYVFVSLYALVCMSDTCLRFSPRAVFLWLTDQPQTCFQKRIRKFSFLFSKLEQVSAHFCHNGSIVTVNIFGFVVHMVSFATIHLVPKAAVDSEETSRD